MRRDDPLDRPLRTAPPAGAVIVVLLVEDELLVRDVATAVLEEAGYVVIAADGPKAALLELETGQRIDLMFTDLHMPGGVDGLQLASLVRDRWPQIGLLLTSGRPPLSLDALPAGGHFVCKPYGAAEVLRHLDELTNA